MGNTEYGNGGNGGGVYGGNYYNCLIITNASYGYLGNGQGGGGYLGSYYNCQILSNFSNYGGGLNVPTLAQDCLIQGNYGGNGGGGYMGTYVRCRIIGNTTLQGAAGIAGDYNSYSPNTFLYNCLIVSNVVGPSASAGNGVSDVSAFNCTISSNSGGNYCVNVWNGHAPSSFTNCIIYGNGATVFAGTATSTVSYCCLITSGAPSCVTFGPGNITNAPVYNDSAHGDFHIQKGSPCIDAGMDMPGVITTDLDGHPRPLDGGTGHGFKWDIGCYEYSPKGMQFKGF